MPEFYVMFALMAVCVFFLAGRIDQLKRRIERLERHEHQLQ